MKKREFHSLSGHMSPSSKVLPYLHTPYDILFIQLISVERLLSIQNQIQTGSRKWLRYKTRIHLDELLLGKEVWMEEWHALLSSRKSNMEGCASVNVATTYHVGCSCFHLFLEKSSRKGQLKIGTLFGFTPAACHMPQEGCLIQHTVQQRWCTEKGNLDRWLPISSCCCTINNGKEYTLIQ